ncbi:membrane hypothetical protein [Desulfarculales bacterium]
MGRGSFLINGLGSSEVQAGNALLCLSLGHILVRPLFGRLSDRGLGSRKWVIAPGLFLSTLLPLGLWLLERGGPAWPVYALLALIGVVAVPGQIMYVHIKELVPAGRQGVVMIVVNLFTMAGVSGDDAVGGAGGGGHNPRVLSKPSQCWPAWWLLEVDKARSLLIAACRIPGYGCGP